MSVGTGGRTVGRRGSRRCAPALVVAALLVAGCGGPEPASEKAPAAQPAAVPAKITEAEARRNPVFQQHWREAWSLYEGGDRRGAIKVLISAIEAEPRFPEGYQLLSRLYFELGDDFKAVEVFEICTRTFEGRPEPWYFKGLHEFRMGRTDDARASFRRAVEIDPDHPESRYRLGLVLLNDGDFAGAREQLDRAWEIDGHDPMIAGALAETLRVTGEYDEVERVAQAALARTPAAAELCYQLAQVRIRDARDEEAEELLRRAIASDPRHQQAHFLLAQLLLRTGREDEGRWEKTLADHLNEYGVRRRFLTGMLAVHPDEPKVPLGLAELELSVGKSEPAIGWLDRAAALGGPAERIAAARATAHFLMGSMAPGDAALVGAGGPGEPWAELARAARDLALRNTSAAADRLDRVLPSAPEDRTYLCRVAELYRQAGERERAAETFATAYATPVPAEIP